MKCLAFLGRDCRHQGNIKMVGRIVRNIHINSVKIYWIKAVNYILIQSKIVSLSGAGNMFRTIETLIRSRHSEANLLNGITVRTCCFLIF